MHFLKKNIYVFLSLSVFNNLMCIMGRSRGGGGGGGPDPPEKSQNIEFLGNPGPDPLKNHKATKPAFNGPLAKHRADDGAYL